MEQNMFVDPKRATATSKINSQWIISTGKVREITKFTSNARNELTPNEKILLLSIPFRRRREAKVFLAVLILSSSASSSGHSTADFMHVVRWNVRSRGRRCWQFISRCANGSIMFLLSLGNRILDPNLETCKNRKSFGYLTLLLPSAVLTDHLTLDGLR